MSRTTGGTATTGALWLGSSEAAGTLSGRLDEVRIYDRALTAAEVQALASVPVRALGDGGQALLPEEVDGPLEVVTRGGQRLLAIHDACSGLVPKLAHHLRRRGHGP